MRNFWRLALGWLICVGSAGFASAQPGGQQISAPKLLGVWSSKGEMKQKEVDMILEGQKHFKDLNTVEDQVTWSYIYKELTRIPMVFNIRTQSTWRVRDQYVCERLTKFSVALVSKPDSSIVPAMMVAKVLEGLQNVFKQQRDAKREHCNQVQIVSPNEFHLKDSASSMTSKFIRIN